MADHVDHCEKVKVIERCQVSPPPGSIPQSSLPLSFHDIARVYCVPVQSIYFYEFPHSSNHFLQTVLPILKHSLSLTLQHFFPLAGNLVIPPRPHFPYFLYSHGDSISFTTAESTAEFTRLTGDTPRDVRDSDPFVPVLPTPSTQEDGTWSIPLMAVQVTIFPNNGFSMCITFSHAVADGRAFLHFMKFWSYVCRTKCDLASSSEGTQLALPFLNREIIKDPKGLKLVFSEELWNSSIESIIKYSFNNVVDDNNDKVRHLFVLSRDHVEKIKKWVSTECKSCYGLDLESLHISTFVVTCALIWVCKVQLEETNVSTISNNDEIFNLLFIADCRNRPELSIPSTYFGNCFVPRIVSLKRSKLMGDKGIAEAVIDIGRKVRDFQLDAMKGVENLRSVVKEVLSKKHLVTIAGSPKFGSYEINFGWGKPKKCELLQIGLITISLSDCRDDEGGVEVGLILGRAQMTKFSTILNEYLRNIEGRCD